MGLVARKLKHSTVYYVVVYWSGAPAPIWEHAGTDKRNAERLDRQRRREVADGTYQPKTGTGGLTVRAFVERWGAKRTNRTADTDRARLRDHVLVHPFADMRMADVEPRHVLALVELIKATKLAAKTVANIFGVLRTMFRDAHLEQVVSRDPCVLPRNTIKRAQRRERAVYSREDVRRLTTGADVDPDRRMFATLAFYLGAREGELCGLLWSDWDREAAPLGCMRVERQYGGGDLKTDAMRKVPVHPDLAAALAAWWAGGFELVYCRRPTLRDHIVPMRPRAANRHPLKPHHTKSSAYKLFVATCKQAGVETKDHALHTTRHTFITWARRGGARKEVLERVTHNAKGDIVDQYTHFDWQPLCEAVASLRYIDPPQDLRRGDGNGGDSAVASVQVDPPIVAQLHASSATRTVSIPGASTAEPLVAKGGRKSSQGNPQGARRRLTPARLLEECLGLATGRVPSGNAEGEVAARLRRVAKTLATTAAPRARRSA